MTDWREYRKTATVEAVQVTEDNALALAHDHEDVEFFQEGMGGPGGWIPGANIRVETREGEISAMVEEKPYLVRGIEGELWLVAADIFEATYEELEEPPEPDSGITSCTCGGALGLVSHYDITGATVYVAQCFSCRRAYQAEPPSEDWLWPMGEWELTPARMYEFGRLEEEPGG